MNLVGVALRGRVHARVSLLVGSRHVVSLRTESRNGSRPGKPVTGATPLGLSPTTSDFITTGTQVVMACRVRRRYARALTSGTGHERFDFTLGLLIDNLVELPPKVAVFIK